MILLPKPPKIIDKKENWACFEIEALYPGYGVTIGNSLRRVLLSSLEGAAITQVNIKGVQHEFSAIPGVLEDVVNIMINLKKMRFKIYTDEPQKASLSVKGLPAGRQEKDVKGSDFKFPTQVELINKSCHIATVTDKKAELEMEIQIEKGIGYQPVERVKKQRKSEIGALPLDAIFTPVKRVNHKVENMRVGERTDFDRLYLDITTDGTITPEEALRSGLDILVKHFSLFAEGLKASEKEKKPVKIKPVLAEKKAKKDNKKGKEKIKKEPKKGKEPKKKAKKEIKKKPDKK
jgi:DNA-directed RNA polymerase subunit alpha